MFGALAGKLLVEGRRPILLNQWVPANHRVSCQGGKGDCWSKKYIENFKKRIYFQPSQDYIFSIPATISNVLWLFWALYSFLKSHIKVKFTYLRSTLNIPRRISIPSQKHGRQGFFSFVMERKIWWTWKIRIALDIFKPFDWYDSKCQGHSFAIKTTQRIKNRSSHDQRWTWSQCSRWETIHRNKDSE